MSIGGKSLRLPYYVVLVGRKPGIYHSKVACDRQVSGYDGAVFAKLPNMTSATQFQKHFGDAVRADENEPNRHRTVLPNPFLKAETKFPTLAETKALPKH